MENSKDSQMAHITGVIEALLFVNEHPVTLEQIKGVLETVNAAEIKKAVKLLGEGYKERNSGISIMEIAGGYQLLTNSAYASYIRRFYKTKHKEKLSKPALETLAIIAYKQPVTRSDIELIRGVNSDGVVVSLLSKELIKTVGRKDVAGRPFLYGTTKQFLEYFGLKSLENLPKLEEFPSLKPVIEQEEGEEDEETTEEVQADSESQPNPDEGDEEQVSDEPNNEAGEEQEAIQQ